MTYASSPALPLVRSRALAQFPDIVAAMSTRQGGEPGAPFAFNLGFAVGDDEARVERHLATFLGRFGIMPDEVAFMEQVHGAEIAEVTEAGIVEGVDAVFTRTPRLALAVRTADCVPVLLYAPGARVVAAVHAGWRGLAERIVERTVAELHTATGATADEMIAFCGPAARGCCYEVDEDVAALFPSHAVTRREGRRPTLDLHVVVAQQLAEAGLASTDIDVYDRCTICAPALFHSHRRDGARSGRMLAVIALTQDED